MATARELGQGHIFLLGFMGAGKSTVGPILAMQLSRPFYDLDDLISLRTGQSVSEIFSSSGEAEFRRLERDSLERSGELEPSVIGLGGGAFVQPENRAIVKRLGVSVWLDCPLNVCLQRIRGDRSRPLLGADAEMKALLEARTPAYALADSVLQVGELPPRQIAERIIEQLSTSMLA